MKFNIGKREIVFNSDTKEISYNWKVFTPAVRTFWDMEDMYSSWEKLEKNTWLYFMYRDVFFNEDDKELLRKNNIRFDITIILPYVFWAELNKTYWHYHPKNKNWDDFQELYQVLSWEAIYLQQNKQKVFYTKALMWDAVNMDKSFWHITINSSETELFVMANLVDDTFSSVYNDYELNNGWMYYLKNNLWEINNNYSNVPKIEEEKKKFWVENSIYDDFIENSEKFNYLH